MGRKPDQTPTCETQVLQLGKCAKGKLSYLPPPLPLCSALFLCLCMRLPSSQPGRPLGRFALVSRPMTPATQPHPLQHCPTATPTSTVPAYSYKSQNPGTTHPTRSAFPNSHPTLVVHFLPVWDAAHERRILHTATTIRQPGDRSVVAEALELVLHCLRENGALHVRILGRLRGELWIEVFRVESIGLGRSRVISIAHVIAAMVPEDITHHIGLKRRLVLALQQLAPIYGMEEGVRLDLGGSVRA